MEESRMNQNKDQIYWSLYGLQPSVCQAYYEGQYSLSEKQESDLIEAIRHKETPQENME